MNRPLKIILVIVVIALAIGALLYLRTDTGSSRQTSQAAAPKAVRRHSPTIIKGFRSDTTNNATPPTKPQINPIGSFKSNAGESVVTSQAQIKVPAQYSGRISKDKTSILLVSKIGSTLINAQPKGAQTNTSLIANFAHPSNSAGDGGAQVSFKEQSSKIAGQPATMMIYQDPSTQQASIIIVGVVGNKAVYVYTEGSVATLPDLIKQTEMLAAQAKF